MMDTKDVINTIGSFSVQAHSLRTIFIPIHSHGSAGHCVLSFKSKSKELEKLFKIRISVKVLEIHFDIYDHMPTGGVSSKSHP